MVRASGRSQNAINYPVVAVEKHGPSLDVKRTHIQIRQLEQAIHDNEASTVDEIQSLKLEKSILSRSPQDKKRIHESAHVVAPFEGVLTWLKNEEGSSIQKGESLVKLAKTEQFRVEATLSDFYANQIWQGKPAEFEYDEQHFFGSVTSIIAGEQGGILNLTIHLDQIPDQNQSLLRQKQRVDVSLITGEPKNTLVIEKGPFCKGSGLQNVFVLRGQEAFRQAANLGASNREYYQVLDGLKEHDEVIISDVSSLAHHSKINVQ